MDKLALDRDSGTMDHMHIAFRLLLGLCVLVAVCLGGFRLAADLREVEAAADAAPGDGRLVPTALQGMFAIERGPVDGPPVLLIHGSVGGSGSWRHTLDVSAEQNYRAAAIDLPPMGYSDRDAAAFDAALIAALASFTKP